MTIQDFCVLKKQLKGYDLKCIVTDMISVTTSEGEYKIIKDTDNLYLVEYIPNVGYRDITYHFSMSGAIDYIKGGDKRVE